MVLAVLGCLLGQYTRVLHDMVGFAYLAICWWIRADIQYQRNLEILQAFTLLAKSLWVGECSSCESDNILTGGAASQRRRNGATCSRTA